VRKIEHNAKNRLKISFRYGDIVKNRKYFLSYDVTYHVRSKSRSVLLCT